MYKSIEAVLLVACSLKLAAVFLITGILTSLSGGNMEILFKCF